MWENEVSLNEPYHFKRALRRLANDPLHVVDVAKESVQVPLIIDSEPVVVTIQRIGSFQEPRFLISSGSHQRYQHQCLQAIRHLFHFNRSLKTVYAHFQQTTLHPLFERFFGTPLILDYSLYFSLIKKMIHQQVNMSFAHELTARFVKTFGFKNEGIWFPPSPATVGQLDYSELTVLQFSRRKAEYIIDTSKLIASGQLRLETFVSKTNEEIMNSLVKIRGIGPWTAECFLLFGLGRKSIFPVADIGVQNGLKQFFKLDRKPTYEQMYEWKQEWYPYGTYAALYLWELVSSPEEESS